MGVKYGEIRPEACPVCGAEMELYNSGWSRYAAGDFARDWRCECGEKLRVNYIADAKGSDGIREVSRRKIGPRRGGVKKGRKLVSEPSLCLDCQRAAGPDMCSWARSFTPVPGWDAEPRFVPGGSEGGYRSYWVKGCPMFEADGRK